MASLQNEPAFSTQDFAERILGYNPVGCAVRNDDFFYLLLTENYTMWRDFDYDDGDEPADAALIRRLLTINPHSGMALGTAELFGFSYPSCAVTFHPQEKLIVGSLDTNLYTIGSGAAGLEAQLSKKHRDQMRTIQRMRTIDGWAYAAGGIRGVGVRREADRWEWLTPTPPKNDRVKPMDTGFADIDGFSANDLYAVGGKGDVWHCADGLWRQLAFDELYLNTVCCGADGRVYISGQGGQTYVGRGDEWRKLSGPALSQAFHDMQWHDGKVWCANDYGVWWIEEGERLVRAELADGIMLCAGRLSALGDTLLLVGEGGAAYRQKGEWQLLFQTAPQAEACQKAGLYDKYVAARWHEFAD